MSRKCRRKTDGMLPEIRHTNSEKHGIDGAVLRYIAVVAMFMDHVAYCFQEIISPEVYAIARAVGRIAYPIFAYCLVSGYRHTHDIRGYAERLLAAAVLSEIPFNLMCGPKMIYPKRQNVMWTLLTALAMLWVSDRIRPGMHESGDITQTGAKPDQGVSGSCEKLARCAREQLGWLFAGLGRLAVFGAACAAASLLHFDYEWEGILIVAVFSLMPGEIFNIPRGSYPRYFFYAFYPMHMLLLVFLKCAIIGI